MIFGLHPLYAGNVVVRVKVCKTVNSARIYSVNRGAFDTSSASGRAVRQWAS